MEEAIVESTPSAAPGEAPAEERTPPEALPEPKKKGRPAGAKDKTPRKKKITVVAEYIQPSLKIEEAAPAQPAEPKRRVEIEEAPPARETALEPPPPSPEPPSPRTTLRESARHMLELRRLNTAARKSHLGNAYTQRLAAF